MAPEDSGRADDRDRGAEGRDEAAEARDRHGTARDKAAEARDVQARNRERSARLAQRVGERQLGELELRDAAAAADDRTAAAADRQFCAEDRLAAARDRASAAAGRQQWAVERAMALLSEHTTAERATTAAPDAVPPPAGESEPQEQDEPMPDASPLSAVVRLPVRDSEFADPTGTTVRALNEGLELARHAVHLADAIVQTEEAISKTLELLGADDDSAVGQRRRRLAQDAADGAHQATTRGERLQSLVDKTNEHIQVVVLRRMLGSAAMGMTTVAATEESIAAAVLQLARRGEAVDPALQREATRAAEGARQARVRAEELYRLLGTLEERARAEPHDEAAPPVRPPA